LGQLYHVKKHFDKESSPRACILKHYGFVLYGK
jgi:hypothetical protein